MILAASVVVLIAVTLFFVLSVKPSDVPQAAPQSPTLHLEEKKAAIYENLRDLQFEYRVGKLSDSDYQQTKLGLQKELAVVLAEIDKSAPAPQASAAKTPPPAKKQSDPLTCPHCKATFAKPMKFCGECGKAMV